MEWRGTSEGPGEVEEGMTERWGRGLEKGWRAGCLRGAMDPAGGGGMGGAGRVGRG